MWNGWLSADSLLAGAERPLPTAFAGAAEGSKTFSAAGAVGVVLGKSFREGLPSFAAPLPDAPIFVGALLL